MADRSDLTLDNHWKLWSLPQGCLVPTTHQSTLVKGTQVASTLFWPVLDLEDVLAIPVLQNQ